MKKLFLLIVCCLAWGISSQAFSTGGLLPDIKDMQDSHTSRIVNLKGSLVKSSLRSSTIELEVIQNDTDIRVDFLVNLGQVTINVTKLNSSVYNTTVNAVAGGSKTISTQGWSTGVYMITFTNATGGYVEGEFEVQ